jgi:hypothetical protein
LTSLVARISPGPVRLGDPIDALTIYLLGDKIQHQLLLDHSGKPRTECCCQSVAFMIAAIVVPFASRSIASTASCLEEDGAAAVGDAGFDVTALDDAVDLDRVALLLVGRFFARAGLRAAFADLDFDVLVAIWLSLVRATASGAATDTSPR